MTMPVEAQEPTRVGIEFEVRDAKYRHALSNDLGSIQSNLARSVADELASRIGFVRFVPDAQEPYRLRFSLDRKDRLSTNALVDRGIWVTLVHPDVDTAAYWFTLRDAVAALEAVGDARVVEHDVRTALAAQDYRVIRELLGLVPVALEALALPLSNPVGWALPFPRELLCIRDETRLRVVNSEALEGGTLDQRYEAEVKSASLDPGPHARFRDGVFGQAATTFKPGVVKEVYVIDHRHQHNCRPQLAAPPIGGGAS
jgi:hypothetical protein